MVREIDQSPIVMETGKSGQSIKSQKIPEFNRHLKSDQFLIREVCEFMARIKAAELHLCKVEARSTNQLAKAFLQLVRSKLDLIEKTLNIVLINSLGKSIRIYSAGLAMFQFCAIRDMYEDKTESDISFILSEVERTIFYLQQHAEVLRDSCLENDAISNKMASIYCELYSVGIESQLFFKEYVSNKL